MKNAILAALAFCAAAFSIPSHATSVLPIDLAALTDSAALVFEGTCIGNRVERDEATGKPVTYTTFAVRDVLKGSAEATHTIKQIGGKLESEGVEYRVHGVPAFLEGEDYVVFLAGVSSAGFSSPMGLGQGKFTVHGSVHGREAANGRDLKEMAEPLLDRMPERARSRILGTPGAVRSIDVEDFKETVRDFARGRP